MALVKVSSTTVVPAEAPSGETPVGFVPIYENAGVFTADLKFEIQPTPGDPWTPSVFTLVSYNGPLQGITATQKDANTIRISGTATHVFAGSTYDFLMPDHTVQSLPENTDADFLTLIRWSPPAVKFKVVTHTIVATFADPFVGDIPMTFNIEQDVYWKLGPALQSFRNLLARGKL